MAHATQAAFWPDHQQAREGHRCKLQGASQEMDVSVGTKNGMTSGDVERAAALHFHLKTAVAHVVIEDDLLRILQQLTTDGLVDLGGNAHRSAESSVP